MSNELAIFTEGLPAYLRNTGIDELTKSLMGSSSGKRISIEGNVFRLIVGGKEISASEERSMDVVVVNAAPKVHRVFYASTYKKGESAPPACWSSDGETPDTEVKEPQSSACATCKQNVRGSGQGDTRACRFTQKLAVVLANDLEGDIYALNLPSQTIFASDDPKKMGLHQYVKFIAGHGVPIRAVVTKMKFDLNSPTPKLFFTPVRPLSEDEYNIVLEKASAPDAIDAVTMHVSDIDAKGVEPSAKPPVKAEQPAPAKTKKPVVEESDDPPVVQKAKRVVAEVDEEDPPPAKTKKVVAEDVEVVEPKVRAKSSPPPEIKSVKNIIDEWSDDDDD